MRLAPVNRVYRQLTGQDYWTSVSRNRTIQKLLSTLGDAVTNTSDYTSNFQPLLMKLMDEKDNPLGMVTSTISSMFTNNALWKSTSRLAGNLWTLLSNAYGETMVQEEGLGTDLWRTDTNVMVNFGQEHVPTGYVAWLMAYDDPAKLYTTSLQYRQISFTGEQDIDVLDDTGHEVLGFRRSDGLPRVVPGSPLTLSLVGDAMVVTIPADRPYVFRLNADANTFPTLSVREGIIGYIRMKTFAAPAGSLEPGQPYRLPLPQGLGQPYTLLGDAGNVPLQQVESSSLFAETESNSDIKTLFDRNLRRLVAVLVLAVLQIVFLVAVSTRAGRRVYKKRRAQRAAGCEARPARGPLLLRRCEKRSHLPLKVAALAFGALSLVMLGEGIRHLFEFLGSIRFIDKSSTQLLVYFTELPQLLLVVMTTLPALLAALNALLWRQGEGYRLRTSRLFAFSSLVCSFFLMYLMAFDRTAWFALWMRGVVVLHAAALLLAMRLTHRTLGPRRRRAPAS